MKITLNDGSEITAQELRESVREALLLHNKKDARGAGSAPMGDIRFLEVLTAQGYTMPDVLGDFVHGAKQKDLSLADYAVSQNILTRDELIEVQAAQYRMPVVDLTKDRMDASFANAISIDQARAMGVIPMRHDDTSGKTVVATLKPEPIQALDDLPRILRVEGDDIQWALISELGFEELLSRAYEERDPNEDIEEINLREESGLDQRAVQIIKRLIATAQAQGASDVHFELKERGMQIRYRLDGVLHHVEDLPHSLRGRMIGALKNMARLQPDETRKPQDGRIKRDFGYGIANLRVVTIPSIHGEEVSVRILDNRMGQRNFDELGLEGLNLQYWLKRLKAQSGMVIVTGGTGAGKSTTLYAALREIISDEIKIMTVEDPVEQIIEGITQIPIKKDEKKGVTFDSVLSGILRADPDIIMVGEIRDRATAGVSVEASLTGHMLLTTLHTRNAVGAITRLKDMGIEPFLIAEALSMVTAQRLIRTVCTNCRDTVELTKEFAQQYGAPAWVIKRIEDANEPIMISQHSTGGCSRCINTGYRGRTGIHEVLIVSEAVKQAIVREAGNSEITKIARQEGMIDLLSDMWVKILKGRTDIDEYNRIIMQVI